MFWRTLGRIIVVAFALLLATVATMFVLITLGLERITGVLHQRAVSDSDMFEAMFNVMNQGLLLSTGFTVIPALLVVFIGEIARIRSALYYVAGGGLSLAVMPLLARFGPGSAGIGMAPDQVVWQVFATAGFAGGFVYWLVAGRNA